MNTIKHNLRKLLLVVVMAVAFCWCSAPAHAADQMRVHMINVGNGDSFLVEYNGHYALIDGGFASHVGQYKNGKDKEESGICRLDKTDSLDALADKVSDPNSLYYSHNLFSFFEHFDNDMKYLTGQKDTKEIIQKTTQYINDFDKAVEIWEKEHPNEQQIGEQEDSDGISNQFLGEESPRFTEEEWTYYHDIQDHKDTIDSIRSNVKNCAEYKEDPDILQAFMELQKDPIIKAENKNSVLFKYYTVLGYQYIYKQIDGYIQTSDYVNGGYNDCLAYLNKLGITKLDYMILSHAHKDHVGGLSAILANDSITVDSIIYNGTSYGTAHFRVFEHEMLDRKDTGASTVIIADDHTNNRFTLGGKVVFTQLGDTEAIRGTYTLEPDQNNSAEVKKWGHIVNNQSLVYRMDFDGASMLFAGDAENTNDANGRNRQVDILNKYKAKLNVDIYKAAHHCLDNASNSSFNNAMSPCFVLVSGGRINQPQDTARKALAGADIWTSKSKGDAVVATLSGSSFSVVNGSGKDITGSPSYKHSVDYSAKTNYGTPDVDKASFATGGRTVYALRYKSTKIEYYNPPTAKAVKVTAGHGWYHDRIQYQLCAGDAGYAAGRWISGNVATLQPGFRGTVYFRFSNKFNIQSVERKTDGYEVRAAVSKIRGGKAVLYRYNATRVDWHPVAGAKQYQVWYKSGKKWKSKGKTGAIYKNVAGLPAGKKVKLRIKAVGKKGYAYVYARTLKKVAKPSIKKNGSKVMVSWKKVTGSTGYQVAVGSTIKATVGAVKSTTVSVGKGKKLWYRVRAYKKANGSTIYGPWSNRKAYTLK